MPYCGVAAFAEKLAVIADRIRRVFVGKPDVVELLVTGIVSGLHVLIEDVPGVGKTTPAESLSTCLGLDFCRIQFTPDLLPGDIIGMTVWRPEAQESVFKHGAIMHQFILADEINRASPRTQSSLLEAMQEQSVTVDGHTAEDLYIVLVTAGENDAAARRLADEARDLVGDSGLLFVVLRASEIGRSLERGAYEPAHEG